MRGRAPRRQLGGQAGTTLIELLVSTTIIGIAVVLLVGAVSTGLLDATLTKRNSAVTAATQYELDKIGAAAFSSAPVPYSECFAVDNPGRPVVVALDGSCPGGSSLRVDVTENDAQPGVQVWTVQVITYPARDAIGTPVSVYKANR